MALARAPFAQQPTTTTAATARAEAAASRSSRWDGERGTRDECREIERKSYYRTRPTDVFNTKTNGMVMAMDMAIHHKHKHTNINQRHIANFIYFC